MCAVQSSDQPKKSLQRIDFYPNMAFSASESVTLFSQVLAANHAPISREFSKKGCPVSMRAELWCQILGVELTNVVS